MKTAPSIGASATRCIKEHALAEYPRESCGFVMPDGSYAPVENISVTPEQHFKVSDADVLAYTKAGAVAFVHSHPDEHAFDLMKRKLGFYPHCPSEADMLGQAASALPWGIVVTDGERVGEPFYWGDFTIDLPLLEVPFVHGITDCYSAVRRWFWQARQEIAGKPNILLPDMPRGDDWWFYDDKPLYEGNFRERGFVPISADELEPGDCGLIKVGHPRKVKQVNHAFVYLGGGLIYHHIPGRLSMREAAGPRQLEVHTWLRYVGDATP